MYIGCDVHPAPCMSYWLHKSQPRALAASMRNTALYLRPLFDALESAILRYLVESHFKELFARGYRLATQSPRETRLGTLG